MRRSVVLALWACSASLALAAEPAVPVKLDKTAKGWTLTRAGAPYLIKGVGGKERLADLAKVGGNSIRTWGAEGLDKILDDAHQNGLTVAVGLWLGHRRHGFDYNNAEQVAEQFDKTLAVVKQFKDHPAVLLWGIGNEMEGYEAGDDAAIWSAINNIASAVKKIDPKHPTMTVVAEIGGKRVPSIHRLCPDIDIVGINSYAGAGTIPERYKKAGGTKPYILTEYGPAGSWESPKTAWGAAVEPTSTAKGKKYRESYEQGVLGAPGLALGSYAFLWGHKQETTATWFGMLLPSGEHLAPVDELSKLWTKSGPANSCPEIASLKFDGADKFKPGEKATVKLTVSDPNHDKLRVRWVLQQEAASYGSGGDAEAVPATDDKAIIEADEQHATFTVPQNGGGWRLFAYVFDDHNNAAVANAPFLVDAPMTVAPAATPKLPLVLVAEAADKLPYVPAGWMGNTAQIKVDPASSDEPHSGQTCLRVDYKVGDGWGGVVWQSPEGDWGDKPGGFNLTGAKKLAFWARGASGGEVVTFQFGLLKPGEKKYPDSSSGVADKIALTKEWKRYEIDLSGKDLSRIKTGFSWTLAGQGQPITFYLDDVQYEGQ